MFHQPELIVFYSFNRNSLKYVQLHVATWKLPNFYTILHALAYYCQKANLKKQFGRIWLVMSFHVISDELLCGFVTFCFSHSMTEDDCWTNENEEQCKMCTQCSRSHTGYMVLWYFDSGTLLLFVILYTNQWVISCDYDNYYNWRSKCTMVCRLINLC